MRAPTFLKEFVERRRFPSGSLRKSSALRSRMLRANLRQTRPRFGVDVTARRDEGVRITEIVSGSPATKAALAH